MRHNQVVYENPSPGNKKGGITTLEEKSLGCVQKGGKVAVKGALEIGETASNGLYVVYGPGNDQVAVTNLAAKNVHPEPKNETAAFSICSIIFSKEPKDCSIRNKNSPDGRFAFCAGSNCSKNNL